MTRPAPSPGRDLLDPEVLTRIGDLELAARRAVEGFLTGLHRSALRGFSTEFDQFRPYTQGDDLKHVDWKIYARTDRFFVKEYEADRNLDARLLVDASGSMGYAGDSLPKLRYASVLAASLAYLLLRQRDRVGLTMMGGGPGEAVPPASRPGHLHHILAALHRARARGVADLGGAAEAMVRRGGPRGQVILISDLYHGPEPLRRSLALLRGAGLEVLVFHLVDRDERTFPFRGALELVDLETGARVAVDAGGAREEYLRRMDAFLDECAAACARAGATYQLLDTAESLGAPLAAFLAARSELRRAGIPWR